VARRSFVPRAPRLPKPPPGPRLPKIPSPPSPDPAALGKRLLARAGTEALGAARGNRFDVDTSGVTSLRRALRAMPADMRTEVRGVVKNSAQLVAEQASQMAPRATGTLAGSYRGAQRAGAGIVRSRVYYARFVEFGFHPRGGDTFVPGQDIVGRALESEADAVVEALGEGIDAVARAYGFR
jgi:hypothetical protein